MHFFDHVSVVSNKDTLSYLSLAYTLDVSPHELLMVGNSFKSDIAPALEAGAYAVYIPFEKEWAHESSAEYDHERLLRLTTFCELKKWL